MSFRRELDDLAEIHDRDAMRHVLYDSEIMTDEQEGETKIELQILQQVHDLRLDGYIERRNRLVAHDQVRLGGKRPRNPDTLALSAGELMRPSIHGVACQAHLVHQRADPRVEVGGRLRQPEVPYGLRNDVAHAHARIKARKRILKDHLDP